MRYKLVGGGNENLYDVIADCYIIDKSYIGWYVRYLVTGYLRCSYCGITNFVKTQHLNYLDHFFTCTCGIFTYNGVKAPWPVGYPGSAKGWKNGLRGGIKPTLPKFCQTHHSCIYTNVNHFFNSLAKLALTKLAPKLLMPIQDSMLSRQG
jgi:hypothetical protein